MHDLKFALRQLAKSSLVTAAVLVALCVGLNFVIFTAIEAVLLRHLPFPTPDQLVTMFDAHPIIP